MKILRSIAGKTLGKHISDERIQEICGINGVLWDREPGRHKGNKEQTPSGRDGEPAQDHRKNAQRPSSEHRHQATGVDHCRGGEHCQMG